MKKTLLFASALSLVLLAGCTKEQPAATAPGAENQLTITGSIVTPDTKIQIGEPANGYAPILWENGDQILVFAANSQGIVPATEWIWQPTMHSVQYGGMATADTTTPSQSTTFTCTDLTADLSGDTYTLWGMYGQGMRFSAYSDTEVSKFGLLPDLSSQTYGETNPYLMVASTTLEPGQTSANLQFTNTAAVLMLNLSGTAKIDRVTVSVNSQAQAPTLAYSFGMAGYANIDVTKAPKVGGTAADFANFIVLPTEEYAQPTATSTITVNTTNLQLTEQGLSIPVGVFPFDLAAGDELVVTVYGTSDTFEEKSIAAVFQPGAASITSNSIVYLAPEPFTAEEFGQMPPKTDWAAGDVVLDDDFSWIMTAIDWGGSVSGDTGTDLGDGTMRFTNLGGWTNSYNNNMFPYYNAISMMDGASSYLTQRGYTATSSYNGGFNLWYENDGMVSTGDDMGISAALSYSLADLNNYAGNVTVTFKAARMTTPQGNAADMATYPTALPISITGNGTIDGATSITVGSADYAPFTFYEYTFIIENADNTTVINFGEESFMATGSMYLDDLLITITSPEDVAQLTGIEVAKQAVELKYSEPENDTVTTLPATGAEDQSFTFKVSGPWKAIYSEGIATSSSAIDGTTKWMQISGASWWYMTTREDLYGNMNPTVFQLSNIQDNTTGAPRTATVQIVSPDDESVVYATYTFTQDAQ